MSEDEGHEGFLVTETIEGAHPGLPNYPLLPDDLLVGGGGVYSKICPGIAVNGFFLTEEQEATLRPVRFQAHGLEYVIL